MKKTNKKGFTIVELVIVIAVVAILAAVLIPTFVSVTKKANESNDVQAARNMNTFLAAAKVTDEVDSILDVYDIFEDSGYSVENYKPLYAGRHYYYDKQYNQIVYVNEADNTIIYPAEHKGEKRGDHDWFSLSMSVAKTKEPAAGNYTNTSGTITATVTNTEEYAYVIQQYNEKGGNLDLTIAGDLDLMGANCAIKEAKGTITIKGADEANPVTIKNVTSNVLLDSDATYNAQWTKADYYAGGIITKISGGNVTIQNVIFENIHVKTPTAGQVGIVIGVNQGGNVVMDNVTVKNSSVIGHRDVGALIGGIQNCNDKGLKLSGNTLIENVKVKTTGGRAALVVGKVNGGSKISFAEGASISVNNSAVSIYNDKSLEQKFAAGEIVPTEWGEVSNTVNIEGQDQFVYSYKGRNKTSNEKEYVAYGFKADALVLVEAKPKWTAITDLTTLKNGVKAA